MKKYLSRVWLIIIVLYAVGGSAFLIHYAQAQGKYDIRELTPDLKQALDARKARYQTVKDLKAQGVIGENNHGYLEALQPSDDARKIADDENTDRKMIYQTIAQQNGIPQEVATIEKVFGQVQKEKAESGEMVQSEDGTWDKK